eukprot:c16641_g1_i1 orf=107-2041(+)
MAWFSNPFSTSFRASEIQQIHSDGDGEADHTHGKGMKEDLSELTKTFTRQLWGVASFLAPAPQDASSDQDGDDEASMAPRSHQSAIQQGDPPFVTQEMDLFEELVDVDFESLMDETLEDKPAEASKGENLNQNRNKEPAQRSAHLAPHQSSDILEQNGLTGISRDLAELKGSVASGFSRILRVVREEIEEEETSKSHEDDTDKDDEVVAHDRKLQGINTFFRPLISNILHSDGGKELRKKRTDARSDDDDEKGDEDDLRKDYDHRTFQPVRNLHDTFVDGFKGISELASSLIPVSLSADSGEEACEKKVVGLTEEVLAFARNISMHRETWLDFPLFHDTKEDEEFEMSVAQKRHAHALELASPGFSALKAELCPDCMSEGCFWKIYFVLLHSRLGKMDAVLLSTPKIMEAREHLLQKLQEEEAQESKNGIREVSTLKAKNGVGMLNPATGTSRSCKVVSLQSAMELPVNKLNQTEDFETDQGRFQTSSLLTDSAVEVQNKTVLADTVKLATSSYKGEETDADRWLNDEGLPHVPSAAAGLRDEDDVSFSDLEEDDDMSTKDVRRSDSTQSFGWVQLNKNQSLEDLEGLRGAEESELQGSRHGDGGAAGGLFGHSSAQVSRKQDQGESSDWSTVEEDDAVGSDFM